MVPLKIIKTGLVFILLVPVLLLQTAPGMCRDSGNKQIKPHWFQLGLGFGKGIYGELGVSYNYNQNRLFSFRLVGGDYVNHRSLTEFAACYGLTKRGKSSLLTASAGLALVKGERYPDSIYYQPGKAPVYHGRKPGNFLLVGLPVDIQIIKTFGNSFALGLTGIANLNTEQSFFAVLLSLYMGKFKT